jgi:beta-phosphoglucomutase family hydrolase
MSYTEPRFQPPDKTYSGYIFDCDGTLVDTMPLHFEAWKAALAEAKAPFPFNWELFVSRAGMSIEQTVRELSAQFDYDLDPNHTARQQRMFYSELAAQVEPVVEVVAFAEALRKAGKPLAVASGSERLAVEFVLSKVGILDWFDAVLTPEHVTRGKPHPDMFLLAASRIRCVPSECLVIEDGEMGFEAARRAQMDFVVVQSRRR